VFYRKLWPEGLALALAKAEKLPHRQKYDPYSSKDHRAISEIQYQKKDDSLGGH